MAPGAANQKRKRGRPANASRIDQDASQSQLTLTNNGTIDRSQEDAVNIQVEGDNRPKKRGRPTKATTKSSPQAGPEPEQDIENVEGQPPRKKRGRPSLSQNPPQSDDPKVSGPPNENPQPRKRGRPAGQQQDRSQKDHGNLNAVAKNQPLKKRGRPSINPSESALESSTIERVKKRGRPPRNARTAEDNSVDPEEADNEDDGTSGLGLRGPGRRTSGQKDKALSRNNKKKTAYQREPGVRGDVQDAEDAEARPRRSGRGAKSSLENKATTEDGSTGRGTRVKSKKRGRPSRDKDASVIASETSQPLKKRGSTSKENGSKSNSKQKSRHRRQKENMEDPEETEEAEQESNSEEQSHLTNSRNKSQESVSRSRKRQTQLPVEGEIRGTSRSSSPEHAPYRHLTAKTRRITRQAIQDKWSPLDSTSIDTVSNLLHSASRPVLLRLNNLTKLAQATSALNAISNRLRSKLSRGLPFPPATTAHRREDELEYEQTVDGIQTLEAQLDPLLHSVALLQQEKERAERELEREYKLLNTISANARSEVRGRRDQLRKVHTLVPELKDEDDEHDSKRLSSLQSAEKGAGKVFTNIDGDNLQDLTGQLGNHMESMRGNLQQIEGITPAIVDSRAALSSVLLQHFGQDTFEEVLLG